MPARKQKAPPRPGSVREVIGRALCRLSDPDAPTPDGRCHWETYDRDTLRIVDALRAAAPEEFAALEQRIAGP